MMVCTTSLVVAPKCRTSSSAPSPNISPVADEQGRQRRRAAPTAAVAIAERAARWRSRRGAAPARGASGRCAGVARNPARRASARTSGVSTAESAKRAKQREQCGSDFHRSETSRGIARGARRNIRRYKRLERIHQAGRPVQPEKCRRAPRGRSVRGD